MDERVAVWMVVGTIAVAWFVIRRIRRRRRTVTIDLGDTVEDLRVNKRKYQIALKELRIQNSEVAAEGQAARAVHRSKRVRGRHTRGLIGWALRTRNLNAGLEADRRLGMISHDRLALREQIVQVERIINRIDALLLEAETEGEAPKRAKRSKKKNA